MDDHDAPRGGGKVVPLRPKTIDDGEIRLGPVRVEPLTAAQEAEAVELADRAVRCRAAAAAFVHSAAEGGVNAAPRFASRSDRDWQATVRPFARNHADLAGVVRARLYKEVQS